jgi:hypothetical protein
MNCQLLIINYQLKWHIPSPEYPNSGATNAERITKQKRQQWQRAPTAAQPCCIIPFAPNAVFIAASK